MGIVNTTDYPEYGGVQTPAEETNVNEESTEQKEG